MWTEAARDDVVSVHFTHIWRLYNWLIILSEFFNTCSISTSSYLYLKSFVFFSDHLTFDIGDYEFLTCPHVAELEIFLFQESITLARTSF